MRVWVFVGLLACWMGCGEDDGGPTLLTPGSDGGTDAAVGDAGVDAALEGGPGRDGLPTICSAGSQQACTCADGATGNQTCLSSQWGQCRCGGVVATGRCKAGYYVGQFSGEYWSGEFDFLGTGQSWIPLPVNAVDQGDRPGFAFTLEEDSTQIGAEFSIYAVRDGCMVGAAETPLFGTHPFFAVIRGELDCNTGFFDGVMTGEYYVMGDANNAYAFEGPLIGEFVPETESLESGTWDVVEHMMNDTPPGGAGTWSAAWSGEVDAAPELPPECAMLLATP